MPRKKLKKASPAAGCGIRKPKLAVISQMDEIQLVYFVLKHCTLNGTCPVATTPEWAQLRKDHQLNLIQKFRQARDLINRLDLDRLDNFLQDLVQTSRLDGRFRLHYAKKGTEYWGTKALSPARKQAESWHHARLVEEGGRPAYPVEELDQVAANPEAFYHIVSPWMHLGCYLWRPFRSAAHVFQRQHDQWSCFRVWQYLNRNNNPRPDIKLEKLEVGFGSKWRAKRLLQWYKERRCRTFGRYIETVNQHLTAHGITEIPLLERDLRRQDKLATWLEYLSFQYWHCDWAKTFMDENDDDGEELVSELLEKKAIPRGTTPEQLLLIMRDAWDEANYLRSLKRGFDDLQKSRELAHKRQSYPDDPDADTWLREEQRANNRWSKGLKRSEAHSERRWAFTEYQYSQHYPWCIGARKLFCYEKLAVWVRGQIPIVRAEVEAGPRCPEERRILANEDDITLFLSPGRCNSHDQVVVTERPSINQAVGDETGVLPATQDVQQSTVSASTTDDPPRPRKRRKVMAPVQPTRRSNRIACLITKKEEETEAETKQQGQPSANSGAAPRVKAAPKPKAKSKTTTSRSKRALKPRKK